jgi:hypothetical protein
MTRTQHYTDMLHMDTVPVLFTRRHCDSVILDLHSSFYFSAILTVLLATCCIHYGNKQMCLTTRLRYIEPEAILVDRCR